MTDPTQVTAVQRRRFDPTTLLSLIGILVAVVVFGGPYVNSNVAAWVKSGNDWSRNTLHLRVGLAWGIAMAVSALIIALRDVKGSLFASRRLEILKNVIAGLLGAGGVLLILANTSGGTADALTTYVGIMNLFGWLGVEAAVLMAATNGR